MVAALAVKLLSVNLDFTTLECVGLTVWLECVGLTAPGESSCMSPKTGSIKILTCLSMNSTKILNVALRLVDS